MPIKSVGRAALICDWTIYTLKFLQTCSGGFGPVYRLNSSGPVYRLNFETVYRLNFTDLFPEPDPSTRFEFTAPWTHLFVAESGRSIEFEADPLFEKIAFLSS